MGIIEGLKPMVEMGGLFSTIIESIAPRQDKKSLKAILALSCQDDKVYGKNASV